MSETRIHYINHASVLLSNRGRFVLTDPWFQKPAFGSWLPTPPMVFNPAYLTALARSCESFHLLVSHGHDDHLDDEWLELFPKSTRALLPKFRAPGTLKRLAKHGFEVTEIDAEGLEVDGLRFTSYFNPEFTDFDAVVSIELGEQLVVHANDNWHPMPKDNCERLSRLVSRYGRDNALYMSQCNIADSFPFSYQEYSPEEQVEIAAKRVEKQILSSLTNADRVGARYFLNYAGHTKTFDRVNPHMKELTGYRDHAFLNRVRERHNLDRVEILDLVPGDHFDFQRVEKLFGVRLDDEVLKDESVRYYEHYGVVQHCDTYRYEHSVLSALDLEERLVVFMEGFNTYLVDRMARNEWRPEVLEQALTICAPGTGVSRSYKLGSEDSGFTEDLNLSSHSTFEIPAGVLSRILTGEINLDHVLVGGNSKMSKSSKDFNNAATVFWLSFYAYHYQLRLSPKARRGRDA